VSRPLRGVRVLSQQASTEPLLRLALALVEAPRQGLTLDEMRSASGASRAGLYRYLDRMRAAGWQIEATHDEGEHRTVRYRAVVRRRR
jgi:predicted DNA-binding transcriptional regulator YafY